MPVFYERSTGMTDQFFTTSAGTLQPFFGKMCDQVWVVFGNVIEMIGNRSANIFFLIVAQCFKDGENW